MIDHRSLQKTLFRMALDPAFSAAVFRGDVKARASTGLGAREMELLMAVDARAIAADKGARRRGQILGNLTMEYRGTLLAATLLGFKDDLAELFLSSGEFHTAVREGKRLPIVFGSYLRLRAMKLRSPLLREIAGLEAAMATLRRVDLDQRKREPGKGRWFLSERAHMVRLGTGIFDWLQDLRRAVDATATPPPVPRNLIESFETFETVLVTASPRTPHRISSIAVEKLEPAVGELLEYATFGLDLERLIDLAERHRVALPDLEAFLSGLVADGVLFDTEG